GHAHELEREVAVRDVAVQAAILHPLRSFYAHEIEAPRDHVLRRAAEPEPERLLLALEHTVAVVEAVEVVGDPYRVGRNRLRAAPLGRLGGDPRELREPLDQIPLLRFGRATL